MKRIKPGSVLMVLGALLLLASAALFCWNQQENLRAGESASTVAAQLRQEIPPEPEELPLTDDYEELPAGMPVLAVDETAYLGVLSLPTLGMELPIAAVYSEAALRKAPCLYSGSLPDGEAVICGHNYRAHFGPLERLRIGDTLTFTDARGQVTAYEVLSVETVQPMDQEGMCGSGFPLTLFTCTYSGQARYAVRCELAQGGSLNG